MMETNMLTMIAAPLLAIALSQSSAATSCSAQAENEGVYPPPGCTETVIQGTCVLICDSSPFLRECGPEN